MPQVTKHDTEQERECHTSKDRRIHLLVRRDTIRVHDFLEHLSEFIRFEHTGWFDSMIMHQLEGGYLHVSVFLLDCLNLPEYIYLFTLGNPAVAEEQLFTLL